MDFPTTSNGFDRSFGGPYDGFVTKLNNNGSGLVFSTYLGGSSYDWAKTIGSDRFGNMYVAGWSSSSDFPLTIDAYDMYNQSDVFITEFTNEGSLKYSTFFGGDTSAESPSDIAISYSGNIYFTGSTQSTDFPVSPGAFDMNFNSSETRPGFVVKLVPLAYDCSGVTPSTNAGQAVLDVLKGNGVSLLNYCGNQVENVIYIPAPGGEEDPNEAFNQWADLARSATREVAFTIMFWDDRKGVPYPGEVVLQGIKDLYDNVVKPDTADIYPNGMTVRILLGVQKQYVPWATDQRYFVLEELQEQGIKNYKVLPDGRVWKVEVALYRDGEGAGLPPGTHSHVKLMVVDSQEMIVSGYHPQYNFGFDRNDNVASHDLGLRVSGPIAANGMAVFDSLWEGSEILCTEEDDISTIWFWQLCNRAEGKRLIPGIFTPAGDDIVLPLYRDDDQKTADQSVEAAIGAAKEQVYVVQNRFVVPGVFHVPWPYTETGLLEYARALLKAANETPTTDIRILVSGDPPNFALNAPSILNFLSLYDLLGGEQPYGDLIRFYAPNGMRNDWPALHTKSFMVDGEFLVIGSQNFDNSAFGNSMLDLDLAEYSLGIEDSETVASVKNYFDTIWENSGSTTAIRPNDSFKARVEQASPGSVILVEPGVYEIAGTVAVPEGVTIFGLDATLKPAAASSSQTGTFKLVAQSSAATAEPLLRINGSNTRLIGLTIQDSPGYAIEIGDGNAAFENVYLSNLVLANNTLGGISVRSPADGSKLDYTIENNTFVGGSFGITIMANAAATARIRNNIFARQSAAPVQIVSEEDGNVEYSYNLFYDCTGDNCASSWHTGNLGAGSSAHDNLFDLDPLFVDPGSGNYHLSSTSPAIDAGDPSILHDLLYDGNGDGLPRIDLGAFEYLGESSQPTPTPTYTPTNTPTFTPTVTQTPTATATQTPTPTLSDDAPNTLDAVTQTSPKDVNLRYYINPSGDEDWFRFEVTQIGSLQVHLTSLPANYDLFVYNAAGQLLGSSTKDKKAAEFVELKNVLPGDYYIRIVGVDGAWDANNPYQLRFNTPGGK
jgi:hypothetical protein